MSEAEWWAAHAEARRAFEELPGVTGVGLGVKETGRDLTGEVAVIVYVENKKPRAALAPGELLPQEVAGVKVDVQERPRFEPLGGTTLDGGAQIRRTPDGQDRPKPGTLAYIATKVAGSHNVMLSCEHVMLWRRQDDLRIFHPDVSRCCGKLKNAVGAVIDGHIGHFPFTNAQGTHDYFLDAAIASIDSGIQARKVIPGVGAISGAGDLTATPVSAGSPITVRKRGAVTGVTEGVVDDVAFPFQQVPMAPITQRVLKIRPKAGHTFPFTIKWKVPAADVAGHLTNFPAQSLGGTATQIATDEIRFDVPVFAVPGDSGAAVVNTADGKIAGLVFSGGVYPLAAFQGNRLGTGIVPTGVTVACHIPPVLTKLGIRIDPSTATTAGRAGMLPGDEISREAPDGLAEINARLGALEMMLDTSPAGRRLNDLVRHHADELVDLVHHRRSVLVEWHRSRGPAFSALLLDALLDGGRALPAAVDGVTCDAMLGRMRKVLAAEGSPALRAALDDNEAFLLDLLDRSHNVDELVANLS